MAETNVSQNQRDEALLQKLGYRQELRRTLGFLSNFAVAFSYISVSTGTFSLFYLASPVPSTSGASVYRDIRWAGSPAGFTSLPVC